MMRGEEILEKIDNPVANCKNCVKADVCSLLRAIGPLIKSMREQAKTTVIGFDAGDMARICRSFVPSAFCNVPIEVIKNQRY